MFVKVRDVCESKKVCEGEEMFVNGEGRCL